MSVHTPHFFRGVEALSRYGKKYSELTTKQKNVIDAFLLKSFGGKRIWQTKK